MQRHAAPACAARCSSFRRSNDAYAGGGIYTDSYNLHADATVVDSTIVDNDALGEHGGGIFAYGGNDGGLTTIRSTTIARNDAERAGGGVALTGLGSTLVIVNATISGNQAHWCCGGGIWDGGTSDIELRNVTVTANGSASDDGLTGGGGGISRNASGTFTLANSIVAGNTAADYGPDCYDGAATLTSEGYNLIGTQGGPNLGGTDCDFAGGLGIGDTAGENPLLGALGDYGGPTDTHLPAAASPAIDTGNPAGCTDENGASLEGDQRGAPRPADGDGDGDSRCDRGAVEVGD